MPELSIVIPVFNNEHSLEKLVSGIQKALDHKLSYEIVMVNDGSSDKSWAILNKLIENYKGPNEIKAFNLKKNYGQENAKMAGLKHASGDHVVFMDADCQHPPEHIFPLLEKCKQGFDVCYANFNNSPTDIFKRLGSWFYNYLATKLLLKPKGIYLSSYNMFNRNVAEYIIAHASPIVNMDAIILQKTQNITQIIVPQGKSLNPKTNYPPIKMIGLFFKLLPGFSTLPLRIILLIGALLSVIGTLLITAKTIHHFGFPESRFFMGTAKILLITFSGFILFAIGIIGEYVGKVYVMLSGIEQYEIQTSIRSGK